MLGCSATLAGLSGLAGAAAPTYWWYLALRVCSGVAAGSMTLAGRALAIEPIGPSWRGVAGVTTCFFSILGGLITVLIAFLVGLSYKLHCYSSEIHRWPKQGYLLYFCRTHAAPLLHPLLHPPCTHAVPLMHPQYAPATPLPHALALLMYP